MVADANGNPPKYFCAITAVADVRMRDFDARKIYKLRKNMRI